MPFIHISESLEIPAPSHVAYDIIADYRQGHPRILPPEFFGRLDVEAGGRGAGTRIRFEMKAFRSHQRGHDVCGLLDMRIAIHKRLCFAQAERGVEADGDLKQLS